MVLFDIACTTLDDARHAFEGGADSIEVSMDLAADGLTPPVRLLEAISDMLEEESPDLMLGERVHVMLRPHNRDFVYTYDEKETLFAEAAERARWCDGFVIGGLLPDGRFDVDLIRALAARFAHHTITLHRALDHCTNPLEALHDLRGIAKRVLVSGSLTTAWEGRETLRAWVQQFGDDYSFVAAGDVNHANIAALVAATGVQECHAARAVRRDGIVAADLVKSLRAACQ